MVGFLTPQLLLQHGATHANHATPLQDYHLMSLFSPSSSVLMMMIVMMMMMMVMIMGCAPFTYDPFTYCPFYLPVVGKRVISHRHRSSMSQNHPMAPVSLELCPTTNRGKVESCCRVVKSYYCKVKQSLTNRFSSVESKYFSKVQHNSHGGKRTNS